MTKRPPPPFPARPRSAPRRARWSSTSPSPSRSSRSPSARVRWRPAASVDVAGMSDAEANDLVERVAYDLCENDALCILEQDVFDHAYACARDFVALKPVGRIRLTDSLCSNLSVLSASIASLLASGSGDEADAGDAHREALKCYACLVYHLADVADAEARVDAGTAAATAAPGAGKADKKAARARARRSLSWSGSGRSSASASCTSWPASSTSTSGTSSARRQPGEQFLGLFTKLACLAMESQPALRSKITKERRSTCSVRAH